MIGERFAQRTTTTLTSRHRGDSSAVFGVGMAVISVF